MKKVYKLILSCAMVCIAIVILAFGVYAASSVSYTVTNTVSYNLEDVFCEISGVVNNAYDESGNSKSSTYSWSNVSPVVIGKTDPVWTIGEIYFNNENATTPISVQVTITNKTGAPITVSPNWDPDVPADYKVGSEVNANAKIQVNFSYSIAPSNNIITLASKGHAGDSVVCTMSLSLISDFDSFADLIDFNWELAIAVEGGI